MSETINTLDELLNDPMVRLVMERDRVKPAEFRMLFEQVRERSAVEATDKPVLPPAHVIARTCQKFWLCP